jgi:hypothetical protein
MRNDKSEYQLHNAPRHDAGATIDFRNVAVATPARTKGSDARRAANRKPRPGALATLARMFGGEA